MAPKLENNEAYKVYQKLANRPLGIPPFGTDKTGAFIVSSGELFCRLDMLSEQEKYDAELQGDPTVRLCLHDTRFSHTGNLRAHLTKGHKVKLSEVHKGASTMQEVIDAGKFFEATIATHRRHTLAKLNNVEVEDYGEDEALKTPQKEKPHAPVAIRRPAVPKKGDGSINKARMKAVANITHKCQGCKDSKEKLCPPTKHSDHCLVWDCFTNDEEETPIVLSDTESELSQTFSDK
ncbi:hypothetical protein VF21_05188 [Pseudogymnoascus sp. 05NY08]|nr:hypothetical protein VF21_05188 [Pseudogymnoascus sp. 05NY08]